MGAKPNYRRKKYDPLVRKTLASALQRCLARDFPRWGGPRILQLATEHILEVVFAHLHVRDAVRHGQAAWTGIAIQQRTVRRQRIEDMQLVPLVLDLVTPQDIEALIACEPAPQRLLVRCLRLCRQAYEQGGLLSNCDLAVLLGTGDSTVASLLAAWEREHDQLVPRRATLHDVGTGLTHKRWICWKRYGEGKTSEQVARETYHSLEAVDRYLGQFDRVRHCRREGLSQQQIAYVLACSPALVAEYAAIDAELQGQSKEGSDDA